MLASPDSPSLLRFPSRSARYRIEQVSPFFKGEEGEGGRRVSLYRSPVSWKGGGEVRKEAEGSGEGRGKGREGRSKRMRTLCCSLNLAAAFFFLLVEHLLLLLSTKFNGLVHVGRGRLAATLLAHVFGRGIALDQGEGRRGEGGQEEEREEGGRRGGEESLSALAVGVVVVLVCGRRREEGRGSGCREEEGGEEEGRDQQEEDDQEKGGGWLGGSCGWHGSCHAPVFD